MIIRPCTYFAHVCIHACKHLQTKKLSTEPVSLLSRTYKDFGKIPIYFMFRGRQQKLADRLTNKQTNYASSQCDEQCFRRLCMNRTSVSTKVCRVGLNLFASSAFSISHATARHLMGGGVITPSVVHVDNCSLNFHIQSYIPDYTEETP